MRRLPPGGVRRAPARQPPPADRRGRGQPRQPEPEPGPPARSLRARAARVGRRDPGRCTTTRAAIRSRAARTTRSRAGSCAPARSSESGSSITCARGRRKFTSFARHRPAACAERLNQAAAERRSLALGESECQRSAQGRARTGRKTERENIKMPGRLTRRWTPSSASSPRTSTKAACSSRRRRRPPLDATVQLQVRLPDLERTRSSSAAASRGSPTAKGEAPPGMGIEFQDLTPQIRADDQRTSSAVCARRAGRLTAVGRSLERDLVVRAAA